MTQITSKLNRAFSRWAQRRAEQRVAVVTDCLQQLYNTGSKEAMRALDDSVADLHVIPKVRRETDRFAAVAMAHEFEKMAEPMGKNGGFDKYYQALGSAIGVSVHHGSLRTARAFSQVYAGLMPIALHPDMQKKYGADLSVKYLTGAHELLKYFLMYDPEDRGREYARVLRSTAKSPEVAQSVPYLSRSGAEVIRLISAMPGA